MKKYLNYIPIGLIFSRLILGILFVLMSLISFDHFRILLVMMIVWAVISDIFDGIIARYLKISSIQLRRMDSAADQFFWIGALVGSVVGCQQFFMQHYLSCLILLGFEGLTYLISYLRFKKEVATHSILSKFWVLTIMIALIQIILTCDSYILFYLCISLGILSRLEIILILIILKTWTSDVPSLYHARLLRKGKAVKRNKLFNG